MGRKGLILCVCQGTSPSFKKMECSTCAKLCPEGAITFPEEVAWIAFIKDRMSTT